MQLDIVGLLETDLQVGKPYNTRWLTKRIDVYGSAQYTEIEICGSSCG